MCYAAANPHTRTGVPQNGQVRTPAQTHGAQTVHVIGVEPSLHEDDPSNQYHTQLYRRAYE